MSILLQRFFYISSLILLTQVSASAFNISPPSFWDGVLLASKSETSITAFVDKTEDIDALTIVANVDGKTITHPVKLYGRSLTIETSGDLNGFIMVKKLGFVVASTKLSEIVSTEQHYLLARVAVMKSMDKKIGYQFSSRSYKTLDKAPTEAKKRVNSDILASNSANQGFTLKEERKPINAKPRKNDYVYTPSTEIVEEKEVEEDTSEKLNITNSRSNVAIKAASNSLLFEGVIHHAIHPKYLKKQKSISLTTKKDAKEFDQEYDVITDNNSWLLLEHKRRSETYSFDGEYIIKLDKKYFDIKYTNKEEIDRYLVRNHISIKPYNKKLLGIYFENHEITALKSTSTYTISRYNNNTLKIKTGNITYTIFSDEKLLVIRENETQLHKLNKRIFNQKERFYYTD
ncbi:hypothetical protein [Flammeovirga kamogawensis]|uniref:Uncharacterized protein n=1 Tax=Flammeovirga kamogawensis TaxID=373891 RepID=A0ABX8H040_9BACT|nr:hypothetical protein [Flammeovirga kamogawensis]MBB6459408.1 hypothetical protein [Flammeovirga kamogawensis]QWG08963.1 hypothetical protein KM029_08470 [Flammeovirga kamogawensis]TRX67253.1 hypothetical protein EO216_03515 [Flammeovirga kamogawensis]